MRHSDKPKGSKLEIIEDAITGRSAEIRFEKSTGWFYCTILEDTKSDRDLSIVRQWAKQILSKGLSIEWTPIISVTEGHDSYSYSERSRKQDTDEAAEISVEIDRFFVGKTPGGVWRKLDWRLADDESDDVIPDDERLARSEKWGELKDGETLRLPYTSSRYRGDGSLLRFTPETWAGLQMICAQINAQRKLLRKTLSSKEGHAQLAKYGAGDKSALLLTAKSSAR
jgi:hypothetical protein